MSYVTNYGLYRFLFIVSNRRPQHILRTFEHICAHRYVLILLVLGARRKIPKVLVVEEILDSIANGSYLPFFVFSYRSISSPILMSVCFGINLWVPCSFLTFFLAFHTIHSIQTGSICFDHGPRIPIVIHWLQLPKSVRLVDWYV